MVKVLKVKPLMTDEQVNKLMGMKVTQDHCKLLIKEDTDVYCKETGQCIAKFRTGIIPANIQLLGYKNLLSAATSTDNRGAAGGMDENGNVRIYKYVNGKKINDRAVFTVDSGVAGYYDRTVRRPNCRLTQFTNKHFDKFKAAYPIIKFVDQQYEKLMPEYYKRQRAVADKTAQDWIIPDTSFSTITINKNYTTAAHKDSGDFKKGFGNLVALRKGTYTGCNFVILRWGVGFDLQNGDLLLCDVHQVHGNTPMVKHDPGATRLSLVMYYREKMYKCLPAKEELKRVQNRKKGDLL